MVERFLTIKLASLKGGWVKRVAAVPQTETLLCVCEGRRPLNTASLPIEIYCVNTMKPSQQENPVNILQAKLKSIHRF